MPESYTVDTHRQPGRIEFNRIEEDAPERICVSLELIQASDPRLLSVGFNTVVILDDVYRVVGWNDKVGGLDCDLIEGGDAEQTEP